MKIILSPARKIAVVPTKTLYSLPYFYKEAAKIIACLKQYSPWELDCIYKNTNENILYETFGAIHSFQTDTRGTPALFAYQGLVYQYLKPAQLTASGLDYAKDTLRILSALYGLLQPFDSIYPYRLEMTNRLFIEQQNLYQFWGNKLYLSLFHENETVINLASEEYAKTIRKYLQPHNVFIDVEFLNLSNNKLKTVTTKAKIARGLMARYILENKVQNPEQIKKFTSANYSYQKELSSPNKYVFTSNEK